jgi:conjugative relaxase-like TrwC/TraI family protein
MTCHVLHAGDGYTYLTDQVASDDMQRPAGQSLADYYTAAGNPPGRWAGSGCADLGISGFVREEQMLALFGEGLHPEANERIQQLVAQGTTFPAALREQRLGRRFYTFSNDNPLAEAITKAYASFEANNHRRASVAERRDIKFATAARALRQLHTQHGLDKPTRAQITRYLTDELGRARHAVSGFDLVFSPVKSVSVLWALGGDGVRSVVERVHEQAWRAALTYGEREAAFTRLGAGGIAYVPTSGFVATAFDHRDSRAGDPDLHTHVAVSNRVMAADGKWRTIDSQQLHKVAVSMSEVYNSLIEQGLAEALGVEFVGVERGPGKRAVREIDGIPAQWLRGFSRRRSQVEAAYDVLVRDYVHRYGHTPPRSVQMKLAQQATLQDRPVKSGLRTLAEQVAEWNTRAAAMLPTVDVDATIGAVIGRAGPAPQVTDTELAEVAAAVIEAVIAHRATWTIYHVRAEAQRQLRPLRFATGQDRLVAVENVTRRALGQHSVLLDVELDAIPELLQRPPEGESVFRRRGSDRFTSETVLDAEQRLVAAAHTRAGVQVGNFVRHLAIRRFEKATGKKLNAGQSALVEHFTSSGAQLAVAIGPPGTGKSTAMRAVREAWETTGGSVIGLAPSAAAASVLGDELGVRADTLHSLITKAVDGGDVGIARGDMLLVDEAGMAGTLLLRDVLELAEQHGAVVRLVGDYRQLAAVEAGGALRLIHHDAGGVELSVVHRFDRDDEAAAVLQFRVGNPRAVGFYEANQRLRGGVRAAVLDELYAAWKADLTAGRSSIMISDSNDVARELSARAQTERRAAGQAKAGGVQLHDGAIAGVGDRIVTRKNRRTLQVRGGRDYVKNGDLWTVLHRHRNGRLTVKHDRHGGTLTLPAWYVAEWVELGYAATIHRSQGLTVDISRSYLSPAAVREAALVALSRGIYGNYAYLDTETVLAPDEPATLPGDLFYRYREASAAGQALLRILAREGAEPSATETLRNALEEQVRLDIVVPQYAYARYQLATGRPSTAEVEDWVRRGVATHADEILVDEAWPALRQVLHEAHDAGADPAALLQRSAAQRELKHDPHDPARSIAKVLHYRIVENMPEHRLDDPARPDGLPGWVPTPPAVDQDHDDEASAELAGWLRLQAQHIADRVHQLGQAAADDPPVWADALGPVPRDRINREQWKRCAGQVAAYRERFHVPEHLKPLLPDGHGGEQHRAQAWVAGHVARTRPNGSDREQRAATEQRTTHVRDRLAALKARMATEPTRRAATTFESSPPPQSGTDVDL